MLGKCFWEKFVWNGKLMEVVLFGCSKATRVSGRLVVKGCANEVSGCYAPNKAGI